MAYQQATWIPAVPAQFFTDTGVVAAGYKLFVYDAGTANKATTYTVPTKASANTNPIVLDAAGRATIFLAPGTYKFVLATPTTADPPAAGDIVWTRDNVGSIASDDESVDVLGVAGEAVAAGQCVVPTASNWRLADPIEETLSIDAPMFGIVIVGGDATDTIVVRIAGKAAVTVAGLLTGAPVYLSTTAGALTITAPDANAHRVPVAYAVSATEIVLPNREGTRLGARTGLRHFYYVSGQGNDDTTGNIELTYYTVTIPAGTLDSNGGCIIIEGTCAIAATATHGSLLMNISNYAETTFGNITTVFDTSYNVAGQVVPFRVVIQNRGNASGAYTATAYIGAASGSVAQATYICATTGDAAFNWNAGQKLHVYAHSNTTDDPNKVVLRDYNVYLVRGQRSSDV